MTLEQEAFVERIRAIWADVLGNQSLRPTDDLLENGLESLTAVRGLARIRRDFEHGVSLAELLTLRTAERIADVVAERMTRSPDGSDFAPEDATHELTTQQRAMFGFIDGKPDAHYGLADLFRIRGVFDARRAAEALAALPARHDALRVRIAPDGSRATVIPADDPLVDRSVRAIEEPTDASEVWRILHAPFDLVRGIPFRAVLARETSGEWLLGIATHHIVSDGWSHQLLLEDLVHVYAGGDAAERGRPVSYWDALSGNSASWSTEPWQEVVSRPYRAVRALTAPAPTAPPVTDRTDLSVSLNRQLRACCDVHQVSPYKIFVTALLRAVGNVLQDPQVIVGTPFSGRISPDSLRAVGYFANTLLVGVDLRRHTGGADLLAEVSRQVHLGQTRLTRDWRELVPQEDRDVFCIRAIYSGGGDGDAPEPIPGTTFERLAEPPEEHVTRPVTVHLSLADEGGQVSFQFRSDIAAEDVVKLLPAEFVTCLELLVAELSGPGGR